MAISDYSTTAASNTSISGINIAENCPPSGINNAIRQMMADIKTAAGDGSMIADGTVTSAKLTSDAVETAKIKDAAVTAAKLADTTLVAIASIASLTDNRLLRTDGTDGLYQQSGITVDDSNNITGVAALTATNMVGTTTNNDAAAGSIGEYIESVIPSGSAVSLVSGTAKNVTSISLTAGDWDVSGVVAFIGGATTVTSYTSGCINTVSNTMRSIGLIGSVAEDADVTDISRSMSTGPVRFSLDSTTTVYLVARATFTTSTLTAFGGITARRVR